MADNQGGPLLLVSLAEAQTPLQKPADVEVDSSRVDKLK